MLKITFSENFNTKKFILETFGKSVTKKDQPILESDSGMEVLNSDGQTITCNEFGGIKNGSEIYIKDDIVSLVNFYRKYLSNK